MHSVYNPRHDHKPQARIAYTYPPGPPLGKGGVAPVVILSDGTEHMLPAEPDVAEATAAAANWLRTNHPDHRL